MQPPIHAAIVAAISGLFLSALSGRISLLRLRHDIYVGDGGNLTLQRTSRAHGVSVEHLMPFLLMLVLYELCGGPPLRVDALGALMLLGRVVQVAGFLGGSRLLRTGGMGLTYAAEVAVAVALLLRCVS